MQNSVPFRGVRHLFGMLAALAVSPCLGQELPPEIQVDRLMVQAEREAAGGEHWSAVITLERTLEIYEEHGLEIPAAFWFRQAGVLQDAGLHEQAVEASARYLREAGREGEHYLAALELYDAAELAKAEAAERTAEVAAALAAAEARRLAAEAAVAERLAAEEAAVAERLAAEEAALAAAVAAVAPEMVMIPAGSFRMGCVSGQDCFSYERPVHNVRIQQAFAVSKYEVTFAQWDACVLGGGCGGYRPDDRGWGRGTRPVIRVSWDDAQEYVGWLSRQTGEAYRLLSESEWEYVARAGSSTAYSWGNAIGNNRANCGDRESLGTCGDQWENTAPVGSFQANGFGVYDMHGNVREWVEDCWHERYRRARSDGSAWRSGDCSRRVLRGGSWDVDPWFLRSAFRNGVTTGTRIYNDGFRVARTLTP